MAKRLYRTDSYLTAFEASVAAVVEHAGHPALVLDQTAFYPSAGGQPHDTGALAGVPVIDVVEREDGEIVHVLAAPPVVAVGQAVRGALDWRRRFDHMQQHSGQHVLSAAFVRTAALDTLSVHIGGDACTLDLPGTRLSSDQLRAVEDDANQCVLDDRLITATEVTDDQLAGIPLRKAPKVRGLIRIVEVSGYDWSACGGTHVRATGQLGMIRVTGSEKRGDATRVHFRCGWRALQHYRLVHDVATRVASGFNVGVGDMESQITRMRDDLKVAGKQLSEAQAKLVAYEAAGLAANAEAREPRGERLVVHAPPGRDMGQLRLLAKALSDTPGVAALLASITDKASFCFSRAPDNTLDMRVALQAALASYDLPGAKGGGAASLAQGAAPSVDPAGLQRALDAAVTALGAAR